MPHSLKQFFGKLRTIITLVILSASIASATSAQQPAAPAKKQQFKPLGTIVFAGLERTFQDIHAMFETIQRPDMFDLVDHYLSSELKDLKGIDRTRPLGYFIYLKAGLPPQPNAIFFAPITSEQEFLEGVKNLPFFQNGSFSEVAPGHHKLTQTFGEDNEQSIDVFHVKISNNYAFLYSDDLTFTEQYEFPDVEALVSRHTTRYDFAASLSMEGISPIMREVFVSFLNQQVSAALQQRDGESDSQFMARSASGLSSMEMAQMLIRDGQEITLGVDASSTGKKVVVDLTLVAKENTPLLKHFKRGNDRPSHFAVLSKMELPLQASLTFDLEDREIKTLNRLLEAARLGASERLSRPETESLKNAVNALAETIDATIQSGKVDAMFQVMPVTGSQHVLVNSYRIVGAETLQTRIREVLDAITALDKNVEIDTDFHNYKGVQFARIQRKVGRDKNDFLGANPALYVGVGRGVVWLVLGGEGSLHHIERCLDAMQEGIEAGTVTENSAPIRVILRAQKWLPVLSLNDDQDEDFLENFDEAMQPNLDKLILELRPVDNGARYSMTLDEGFVRLLGLILSHEYDKSQL